MKIPLKFFKISRRKSSSSRSKSRSRSYSRSRSPPSHPQHNAAGFNVRKFSPDDKRRQQTSGMENVSQGLCDDDYLRKMDEQRRKREELMRKKEESRIREVNLAFVVFSSVKTQNLYEL